MKIEKSTTKSNTVIEVFKALKTGEISSIDRGIKFDDKSEAVAKLGQNKTGSFRDLINFASDAYDISSDIKDYVVVPVPVIITSTPNKNGVAFPRKSLTAFSETHGCPGFQTWRGKPTYLEHDNHDPKKAKGIILDSVMNPLRNYPGFFKVVQLLSFDRTKDPILYDRITNSKLNSYSMGSYVDMYGCSRCGAKYSTSGKTAACSHIDADKVNFYKDNDGNLVFKTLHGIEGFEVSAVEIPAFRAAVSDYNSAMDPKIYKRRK